MANDNGQCIKTLHQTVGNLFGVGVGQGQGEGAGVGAGQG